MAGGQPFNVPGDSVLGDGPDDKTRINGTLSLNGPMESEYNWPMPLYDYRLAVGDYMSTNSPYCNGTSSSNRAIDTISLAPFVTRRNINIDTAVVNVTANNVGAVAKILIYEHDYKTKVPTRLLAQTAEFAVDTIGQPTTALNYTFLANKQYWIGYFAGVVQSQITLSVGGTNFFATSAASFHLSINGLSAGTAYASGAPSYITPVKAFGAPVIGFRIATIS